jgi:uncharacterized protein (DUF3820 family)
MTDYLSNLKSKAVKNAETQPAERVIDVDNPPQEDVERLLSKTVNFGKYKGSTFKHVLLTDYNYFKWMQRKMKPEWVMTKVFSKLV